MIMSGPLVISQITNNDSPTLSSWGLNLFPEATTFTPVFRWLLVMTVTSDSHLHKGQGSRKRMNEDAAEGFDTHLSKTHVTSKKSQDLISDIQKINILKYFFARNKFTPVQPFTCKAPENPRHHDLLRC